MKKHTIQEEIAQGATLPQKSEKRIQITIAQLKELAVDTALLHEFTKTIENNPDMKAPIAWQFAKAILKQIELEQL